MEVNAQRARQEGRMHLHQVGAAGPFSVVHLDSTEVAQLPTGATWALHFDARGRGYLVQPSAPGNAARWVDSFLTQEVWQAPDGRLLLRSRQGGAPVARWLDEVRRERRLDIEAKVDCRPHRVTDLVASLLALPADGARVFWSLPALYAGLGLTSHRGQAGRWTDHGWKAWATLQRSVGLSEGHLRRGVQHNADNNAAAAADADRADDRVFVQRSVSSHLLLALMCRWTCDKPSLQLQNETDRACCLALLQSWALEALGDDRRRMFIYCARDEIWHPPAPPSGTLPVGLDIVGLTIDLTPLIQRYEASVVNELRLNLATASRNIVDVLRALAAAPDCLWLWRQLVWFVGSLGDQCWHAKLWDQAPRRKLGDLSDYQLDRELARYFLGVSRAFHGATNMSMAIDASRVGQKLTMCGILVQPNNLAAAYPPQALDPPMPFRNGRGDTGFRQGALGGKTLLRRQPGSGLRH